MSILTRSKFYYDFEITANETFLNFNEGIGELTAVLNPGLYSMTGLATEAARALNETGTLTYTVTVDRETRVFTISTTATISLLCLTGSNIGLDAYEVLGFDTTSDKTGASSYAAENAAGKEFTPQFFLQEYIDFDDFQGFASSNVNESASGKVEIYSLGSRQFAEFDIKFQNNGLTNSAAGTGGAVEYDATGHDNLVEFMQYTIKKGDFEFMKDRDTVTSFDTVLMESAPGDKKGTSYKLKELYSQNLQGWFNTGKIKLRKV